MSTTSHCHDDTILNYKCSSLKQCVLKIQYVFWENIFHERINVPAFYTYSLEPSFFFLILYGFVFLLLEKLSELFDGKTG